MRSLSAAQGVVAGASRGGPIRSSSISTALAEEVIAKYERWLCDTPEGQTQPDHIEELRGKDLLGGCAPEPCPGDVLLRFAIGEIRLARPRRAAP